ncbi:MAG: hypothetical protein ABIS03_06705 [Gemmatimonadaceae bacterium]
MGDQWDTQVRRLDASDGGDINILEFELMLTSRLHDGDLILFTAGDVITANGEPVEGVAWIDESAMTGDATPTICGSRAERCAVARGMRILSGWLAVRIHGPALADPLQLL